MFGSTGYLHPAGHRTNLTVLTRALSQRLLFEGYRATGVEFRHRGRMQTALADCEGIVTSGAIGTPKQLMLLGIGPGDHVRSLGIEVCADVAQVGSNLSDHVIIDLVAELHGHPSLDKYRKLHHAACAGLTYALFRSGPVASNVVEGGLFWYSADALGIPDSQFHFLAGVSAENGVSGVAPGRSGITLNCYGLRPKAHGTVRLASNDPDQPPQIDPNFIGHSVDLETTIRGLKTGFDIFKQPALARCFLPVVLPDALARTDDDFRNFVRNHCRTSYHTVGTCRMGSDDHSVVDTRLKLRGFEGLQICDSSVFPSLVGSNTNVPTALLAEKASDLISQDAGV